MRVKILKDVEYAPTSNDARSCHGQLRLKPRPIVDRVIENQDGTKTTVFKHGPMMTYFPASTERRVIAPELRDEIAADFIASGVAKPFDGERVRDATDNEILDGITVENGVIVK